MFYILWLSYFVYISFLKQTFFRTEMEKIGWCIHPDVPIFSNRYWHDWFMSFSLILFVSVFLFIHPVRNFYLKLGEYSAILATSHFVKSSGLAPFLSPTWQSVCESGFFYCNRPALKKCREWEIQIDSQKEQ